MNQDPDKKKLENNLVQDFLKIFYEKIGYYPVVTLSQKQNTKALSLEKLEEYFIPYLPVLQGKKRNLISKNRRRPLPELRFIFCHIARSMNYSLKEIGRYLGGRDHTTIIHGLNTFDNLYETDENFRKKYQDIVNIIKKDYESSIMEYTNKIQNQS